MSYTREEKKVNSGDEKQEDEKNASVNPKSGIKKLSVVKRELEKHGVKTWSPSFTLHDEEDKEKNLEKQEDAKKEIVNPNSLINTSYALDKLNMALDDTKKGVESVVKSKPTIKIKLKKRSEFSTLNDDVILAPPSVYTDFDEAQVDTILKKVMSELEEKYFDATPTATKKVDVFKGSPALNFGPFSPKPLRLKIIEPKPPESTLLLEPPRQTYLRVRGRTRSTSDARDLAPSTMGPPEPRVCKTPYEMVKQALTFLRLELGIANQCRAEAEYSLSKVSPMSFFSVEEVIMELGFYLKSMSEDISSDEMKARLSAFQSRLGLPDWPQFYSLMYISPADVMHFLAVNGFEYDADDIGSDSEDELDDGKAAVNKGVKIADDPYKSMAMHSLSHYDALEIVHTFVNRLSEGIEMDEDDFLRLQYDLHLPGCIELYDMYQKKSMQEVINYIDGYFAYSRVASKKR